MSSQGNADSGVRDGLQGGAVQAVRSPAVRERERKGEGRRPMAPPKRGSVMKQIVADLCEVKLFAFDSNEAT
ncbi:hypothetical protein JCGZ_12179 [Jatropha curcas]|uniref:Uncharacterized protein n=1 Tax=Jatropha curcas TaxID=180498 RepID=A0A067K9U3_JATCU|nr:hypothetical protein JCGZ_12179 [Jatropha curcas]